ncbi:MAG: BlaI/MecI/CopY family transcriptional regulator [Bacteroidetes Order II. Incertae sedis bacterium]|nr:BlaI/MecI/CopY family transcriptional regulator [Bacteroidetes Order II. bacterium]
MKRTYTGLGETEMELLRHVWEAGRCTVADIHKAVMKYRPVAYTTVMSVMKKLADKGYLKFQQEGNAYVYWSAEPAAEMQGKVLQEVVEKVFSGSPIALVQTLVEQGNMSEAQREELLAIIEQLKP